MIGHFISGEDLRQLRLATLFEHKHQAEAILARVAGSLAVRPELQITHQALLMSAERGTVRLLRTLALEAAGRAQGDLLGALRDRAGGNPTAEAVARAILAAADVALVVPGAPPSGSDALLNWARSDDRASNRDLAQALATGLADRERRMATFVADETGRTDTAARSEE